MKLRPRSRETEEEEEDDGFADPEPPPPAGYRVAGNIEVRSKELEQDLAIAEARVRSMERELFAARKLVRRRKAATAISRGGIGATIATLIAFVLYGVGLVTMPPLLLGLVVIGFLFGALAGMRWDNEDDNFPKAPPPRLG
jgi:hypothetical protein